MSAARSFEGSSKGGTHRFQSEKTICNLRQELVLGEVLSALSVR